MLNVSQLTHAHIEERSTQNRREKMRQSYDGSVFLLMNAGACPLILSTVNVKKLRIHLRIQYSSTASLNIDVEQTDLRFLK